jgi:DNA-binding response OmpR family regulator
MDQLRYLHRKSYLQYLETRITLRALGGGMAEEKILIIEDEPDVASMMESLLDAHGHPTVIAYDGRSGLDLALNERPGLILLDLRLPQMNGVKFLSKLQEQKLDVPVVVVTAMGSEELVIRALRMGVKDYIKKPFDPGKLVRVIERALQEARLRRENARLYQHLQESQLRVAARSTDLKKVLNRLVRLQRITLALSTLALGADLQDVFQRLTEYAATLLEVKGSAVLLYDQARQELVCQEPAFGIAAGSVCDYRIPLNPASPIWDAWQRGQSLVVNDLTGSPLVEELGLGKLTARDGVRSTMFSVLRMGGRSIGLFQVMDKLDGNAFTADDQRVLEIFASQSAIAIENARLFTRKKRRVSEMETLVGIAQTVAAAVADSQIDKVFDSILQGATAITGAPNAIILTTDEESGDIVCHMWREGQTFVTKVPAQQTETVASCAEGQRSTILRDVTEPMPDGIPWVSIYRQLAPGARSFLCVPIASGSEKKQIGLLGMGSPQPGQFGPDDLQLLEALANQAAIAIQNARHLQTVRI